MRYCCASNQYERFTKQSNEQIAIENVTEKWQSCAYRWQNIFRKEEKDWKMVYLARAEDTEQAEIEWKFDFSDRKLIIKDVQLKFGHKIYESGEIDIMFLHKGKAFENGFRSILACPQLDSWIYFFLFHFR